MQTKRPNERTYLEEIQQQARDDRRERYLREDSRRSHEIAIWPIASGYYDRKGQSAGYEEHRTLGWNSTVETSRERLSFNIPGSKLGARFQGSLVPEKYIAHE